MCRKIITFFFFPSPQGKFVAPNDKIVGGTKKIKTFFRLYNGNLKLHKRTVKLILKWEEGNFIGLFLACASSEHLHLAPFIVAQANVSQKLYKDVLTDSFAISQSRKRIINIFFFLLKGLSIIS